MQTASHIALNTDVVSQGQGTWLNIGQHAGWSLYLNNLEAGGIVQVFVSNSVANPSSLNPVDAGFLVEQVTAAGNAMLNYTTPVEWIRVVKTQAGTNPSVTIGTLKLYGY